jgi:hypothetical protein
MPATLVLSVHRAFPRLAVLCVLALRVLAQPLQSQSLPGQPAAMSGQPDQPIVVQPTKEDLLFAVGNMASIFSRTAPGLLAKETLHQRGRRGFIRIIEQTREDQAQAQKDQARKDQPARDPFPHDPFKRDPFDNKDQEEEKPKPVTIKLPQDFHVHDVVSEYALGQMGDNHAIHELRSILTIDNRVIAAADEARHSLTIGFEATDDTIKRQLLENFERNRLEGAVTDFGQLILLFAAAKQDNYDFAIAAHRILNNEPVIVLSYKQVSGTAGLTVFRERTAELRPTEGEIWVRQIDLVPLRITMFTEEPLGNDVTIHDRAIVDYTPTEFGLAPAHIQHTQLLNRDVLVENDLKYTDYQRLTPGILP